MLYLVWGIVGVLLIALLYVGIPTYYNRKKGAKKLKSLLTKDQIMLTFDDGPDARYTGKLLDVLAENNIKATFFVVAAKVPANIDIIKRMQIEGHTIALHSLYHKNAWFMGYERTKKEFEESLAILARNGVKINYYRPAWGLTNLFSAMFAKKYKLKLVFWNVMAEDWSAKSNDQIIIEKLIKRSSKRQVVICLHDSGEGSGGAPDAPLNTICALTRLLPVWREEGTLFVTPGEVF